MKGAECVMLGSLLVLSVIDLRTGKIPVLPVALLGMAVLGYRGWNGAPVLDIAAGVIPGVVLLLVARVTKESIGYGDGIVLLVLGVFCGAVKTVAILGMSLMIAAVLSMILLVLKKAGRKTALPFIPCLCSAYLLCLLW